MLGIGSITTKSTPVQVPSLDNVASVAGGWHSLAVKSDGTVYAWGPNTYGQLGIGWADSDPHSFPVPVPEQAPAFLPKVTTIGNPFSDKPAYARNVWDMQVFDGKIYFGYGDWSNNAGPVSIYSLDPATDTFSNEYNNIPEESIDAFKVIGNKLYIPGPDPREAGGTGESWDYGNLYVLDSGSTSWKKYRTIPGALHVLDLEFYNEKLYAGIGVAYSDPKALQNQLLSFSDGGMTWASESIRNPLSSPSRDYMPFFYRIYSLFQLGGDLYGAEHICLTDSNNYQNHDSYFIQVSSNSSEMVKYSRDFVPGAPIYTEYVMRRQLNFKDKLLFILFEKDGDSDSYIQPFAMYAASSISSGTKIGFPETAALPIDILTRDDEVYVLTHIQNSDTNFTNIVYKTNDLKNWTEVFRFKYPTFARSFEEVNGDFYLGMGAKKAASPSSGNVIIIESLK